MRHVFIINPAAGKTQKAVDLIPRIEAYFAEHGGEYEILTTEKPGDATELAREACAKGTPVRLYACGDCGGRPGLCLGTVDGGALWLGQRLHT